MTYGVWFGFVTTQSSGELRIKGPATIIEPMYATLIVFSAIRITLNSRGVKEKDWVKKEGKEKKNQRKKKGAGRWGGEEGEGEKKEEAPESYRSSV